MTLPLNGFDELSDVEQQLASRVLAEGLVERERLQIAIDEQRQSHRGLHLILSTSGADARRVVRMYAEILQLEFADLDEIEIEPLVARLVPHEIAYRQCCIPIRQQPANGAITLAIADPFNYNAIDDIALMTGREVRPALATMDGIRRALQAAFEAQRPIQTGQDEEPAPSRGSSVGSDGERSEGSNSASSGMAPTAGTATRPDVSSPSRETSLGEADRLIDEIGDIESEELDPARLDRLLDSIPDQLGENDAPMIRLANLIISQAIQNRASEILIEPGSTQLTVRYRVGGMLETAMNPPARCASALVQTIKVMAQWRMNAPVWRQQPRIRVRVGRRPYSLRMAITPTLTGEAVHFRILDHTARLPTSLEQLGIVGVPEIAALRSACADPGGGLVIVTGPRGAGKTMTLYTLVSLLRDRSRKIMTVEDPVDGDLADIDQVECRQQRGFTLSHAIRSCLRHHPDVLMIGDLRTGRAARLALRAALDGCRVIAGITTTGISAAIARLETLGLRREELGLGLKLISHQRLIQRNRCLACRQPVIATEEAVDGLQLSSAALQRLDLVRPDRGAWQFYRVVSCPHRAQMGVTSDLWPVFEVLPVNEGLATAIAGGESARRVYRAWHDSGGVSLFEHAARMAMLGQISLDELLRLRGQLGLPRHATDVGDD